jgi:nicotinamidase/pyrazinamidase
MSGRIALLIIDVQNDFCPGGALPVEDGDQVVPVLNRYIGLFSEYGLPVYATRDWHPRNTPHFIEYGGQWPPHCVQNTWGAQFHAELDIEGKVTVVSKGMTVESEGYSGFEAIDSQGRSLDELLQAQQVVALVVGGLATDYCVRATVLDAQRRGYETYLAIDAVRGIDAHAGDVRNAVARMERAGAQQAAFGGVAKLLPSLLSKGA